MKRFIAKSITAIVLVVALAFPATSLFAAPALAASNPSGTGQPSQTCLSSTAPNEPGQAASSPGSPFNEPGFGSVNGGIGGQNYSETSQYDVACYQVSQR